MRANILHQVIVPTDFAQPLQLSSSPIAKKNRCPRAPRVGKPGAIARDGTTDLYASRHADSQQFRTAL
jgi:hypothetical protein